jgi:AraC-like DNA-binding protein
MIHGQTRSPSHFSPFATRDSAEMERVLVSVLAASRIDLNAGRDEFYGQLDRLPLGPFEIFYTSSRSRGWFVIPADNVVRLQFGLAGGVEEKIGKIYLRIARDVAGVTPAHVEREERSDAQERIIIHFNEPELRRKLMAILGSEIDAPVRFEASDRIDHPDLRMIRAFAGNLLLDGRAGLPEISSLVQAELGQAWAAALLCGASHNYSHLLSAKPADAGLHQVRQAIDYIEANWNKPLLVEDLTAAIGVSTRSLFRSFKKSKNISPMAYVRLVRLAKANRMLLDAGRGTTVADVATACGFKNAGHFAKDYRDNFGELPSETLARTRTLLRLALQRPRSAT